MTRVRRFIGIGTAVALAVGSVVTGWTMLPNGSSVSSAAALFESARTDRGQSTAAAAQSPYEEMTKFARS